MYKDKNHGSEKPSRDRLVILESFYPVRQARGFGHLENENVLLTTKEPSGRHVLSKNEYAILSHCDGTRTIADITQLAPESFPELSGSGAQKDVAQILYELERNSLIRFCEDQSISVPAVTVQFHNFWPGFNPRENCFLLLMSRDMLAIVTDRGVPDLYFQSAFIDSALPDDVAESDGIRVFVSDGIAEPNFDIFDYAFSPFDVNEEFAACHSRVPFEDYSDTGRNRLVSAVHSKFSDFLFPLDVEELRFDFSDSTTNGRNSGVDTAASPAAHPEKIHATGTAVPPYHICLTTDAAHSEGLFALVNSILQNTKAPENFFFHILIDGESGYYEDVLSAMGIESQFEVVPFTRNTRYREYTEFLETNIRVIKGIRQPERIRNVMNFSRFYLPDIFPTLNISLYLDVDMIVQVDLAPIFDVDLSSTIVAAPVNRPLERYHGPLKFTSKGFNAGALLINFARWREKNVLDAIQKVMVLHKQRTLFPGGTQPILNTVFYQQCLDLDARWNVTDLGYREDMDPELLESAWILHWTGRSKPWLADGLYKHLWEPYSIPAPRVSN